MNDRPGCLAGLAKLFLLNLVFDWLQEKFGFGQGGVCGCGCGFVLLLIFIALACAIFTDTNWLQLSF